MTRDESRTVVAYGVDEGAKDVPCYPPLSRTHAQTSRSTIENNTTNLCVEFSVGMVYVLSFFRSVDNIP
jgi:hypothetical protein